jgi:hypothetical protein
MKNIILVMALMLSTNVLAKKCKEYFDIGEDAYMAAVNLNNQGNAYMKDGNSARREGNLGVACGNYELGINHYQATLELMSEAVLEMWGAERNCFRRRDRARATENLALLKRSSSSVKANMDKGLNIFRSVCQ